MLVRDVHTRGLIKSTALSGLYVEDMIPPLEIVRLFNQTEVSFVLIGLHGIAGWMDEPRATEDVDVVVASKHRRKAVRVLTAKYRRLFVDDLPGVIRLRDPATGKGLIDIVKPTLPLFRALFKNARRIRVGKQQYRIPTLEMAIALKFAPMTSPNREAADKHQDAHYFILLVKRNPGINKRKLSELGDLVYPGGGAELSDMVRKVEAGEKLVL